jgi:hypothetical protein
LVGLTKFKAQKAKRTQSMDNEIRNFAQAARAYCAWVEGERKQAEADVRSALLCLSGIYSAALLLPDLFDDSDEKEPSAENTIAIKESLAKLPVGFYGVCFDPLIVPPEEPVIGDVIDDLTDIWLDLKRGLLAFDEGKTNLAVWTWKFHFEIHWGRHAVSAISVLHCWLISNIDYRSENHQLLSS